MINIAKIANAKNIAIVILGLLVVLETIVIISNHHKNSSNEYIDLSNSTCFHSEHLGRRLYFHVCLKKTRNVYDIRYFWKEGQDSLKPKIIGVQLTESEFKQVCKYAISAKTS